MSKKPQTLSPDQTAKIVFGMLRGTAKKVSYRQVQLSLAPFVAEDDDELKCIDIYILSALYSVRYLGRDGRLGIMHWGPMRKIDFHLYLPSGRAVVVSINSDGKVSRDFNREPTSPGSGETKTPSKDCQKFLKKISSLSTLYGEIKPGSGMDEYGNQDVAIGAIKTDPSRKLCWYEHTVAIATKRV